MSMIDALVQELEREAETTRRVLERVPDNRLGWKPHDRSMSLGQLSLHVATIPGNIAKIAAQPRFEAPNFVHPAATSAAELIPAFEQSIADARQVLRSMDDQRLQDLWSLVDGDRVVMSMPVGAVVRTIMLNHWYHHRGQLAVYLRQVGVPVPSIYGPSADENPFLAPSASTVSV